MTLHPTLGSGSSYFPVPERLSLQDLIMCLPGHGYLISTQANRFTPVRYRQQAYWRSPNTLMA
jgi:hypothetical protein